MVHWTILLLFIIVMMTGLLLFCIKFFNYKFCKKIVSVAIIDDVIHDIDAYNLLEDYKHSVILIGFVIALYCISVLIFGLFISGNSLRNILIVVSTAGLSLVGVHICLDCKNLLLLKNNISHRTKIKKIKALIKS